MNLRLFPNLQSNLLMTAPSTWSETQTHVSSSRSLAWIKIQVCFFLFLFTKIHMSNSFDYWHSMNNWWDSNVVANGNFDPLQLSCQMRLSNFSMWFWSFTYLMNINNFSWNVCLCVWYSQGKLLWLVFSHLHGGFAQSFPKKSSLSRLRPLIIRYFT